VNKKILLFGGTGFIGQATKEKFEKEGWQVVIVSLSLIKSEENDYIFWNYPHKKGLTTVLQDLAPFDAVCWAQGTNTDDSVYDYEIDTHQDVYSSNVLYVLESLKILLDAQLITKPAKFCVLSSIWQELSKQNKLSYAISKSALKGLVLSACNDLGKDGHLINAVLPGVIDTPMTRTHLSQQQINSIEQSTQFGRLPSLNDVANTVYSLCSENNTGVTGNFITVDLGYSHVRKI